MDDILPEGVSEESKAAPAETQRVGYALSELSEEYVFFNHGALFAFAEFEDPHGDPVNEWYAQQPKGTVLIKHPFENKIFEGINAPCYDNKLTWNNVICMVSTDSWKSLFPFMCGIVARNLRKKTFYQVFPQRASVLDPVMVARHSLLHPSVKRVNVVVFGVSGNKGLWSLQEPKSLTASPRMVRSPPDPNAIAIAESVLGGDLRMLKDDNEY